MSRFARAARSPNGAPKMGEHVGPDQILARREPQEQQGNVERAQPPRSRRVNVALQADPAVKATGTVREVSPTIDPASGSVKVKVGLDDTPPQMTLGAAVIGAGEFQPESAVVLPWGALFQWQGR